MIRALSLLLGIYSSLSAMDQTNSWRGPHGHGVFPASDIVTSADEASGTNIVWKLPLPFIGCNSPVYSAGKVFVLCDAGWDFDAPQLLCVDVNDGKLLWQHPVDNLDGRPDEEASWAREQRAKEYAMAKRARELQYAHNTSTDASAKAKLLETIAAEGFDAKPDKKRKGRIALSITSTKMVFTGPHKQAQDYKRLNKEGLFQWEGWYYAGIIYQGATYPSIVTDGKLVWASTNHNAVACFDMDGNRKWLIDARLGGHSFHGSGPISTSSPLLVAGKLIISRFDITLALDALTGKELWRHQHSEKGAYQAASAAVAFTVSGKQYLYLSSGEMVTLEEGKAVGTLVHPADTEGKKRTHGKYFGGHCQSLARDNMVWVLHCGYGGGSQRALGGVYAFEVSESGGTLTGTLQWQHPGGGDTFCANLDGDKIYIHGKGAKIVNAMDGTEIKTGNKIAHRSPSFAITDKYLITLTSSSQNKWKPDPNYRGTGTLTFYDKNSYKQVGQASLLMDESTPAVTKKRIARVCKPWWSWGRSSPTAWGNRVFVRSHDALYCLGDPSKPFAE